jgi:hypothetical protein
MMDKVYADHAHQNPGTHLRGDIPDDEMWQDYWRRLIVFPSQTYDAPLGAVGCRFIEMPADMLAGIQVRKMNAERFIVFQIVLFQRWREVKKAKDVRKGLTWRKDARQQGKFSMLDQNTERTMKSLLSTKQGGPTPEQRAKIFHQKMLRGDVRGAVRYLTGREKGGTLQPTDIDEKIGDSVKPF